MLAGQGSKHRGRMETATDILELMPCKKSHLMFQARVTHQKLEEYLDFLLGKNCASSGCSRGRIPVQRRETRFYGTQGSWNR